MVQIQTLEQMNNFLEEHHGQSCWIIKHSATCPISRRAFREVEGFLESPQGKAMPMALIVIQEAREVSNEIALKFGVQHQSPQILLVQQEAVIWHTSHGNITAQQLQKITDEQLS